MKTVIARTRPRIAGRSASGMMQVAIAPALARTGFVRGNPWASPIPAEDSFHPSHQRLAPIAVGYHRSYH